TRSRGLRSSRVAATPQPAAPTPSTASAAVTSQTPSSVAENSARAPTPSAAAPHGLTHFGNQPPSSSTSSSSTPTLAGHGDGDLFERGYHRYPGQGKRKGMKRGGNRTTPRAQAPPGHALPARLRLAT